MKLVQQFHGGQELFDLVAGDTVLDDVRTALLLGLDGDLHLVPLVHPAHRHDLLRDGGGEQAHVGAVLHLLHDAGDVLVEAHVQHPVRLVQDHCLDAVKADVLPLVVVHKPPRRGHDDLGLFAQLLGLGVQLLAAVEHRHPDALLELQQAPELVPDLQGQLPGGSQDRRLHRLGFRVNVLDDGDPEGEGLSGAGGGLGDDVLPLHQGADGLGLDLGGVAVALLLQCLQYFLADG